MEKKISNATIALHWIVGIGIITLIVVGYIMKEYKMYDLYPLHKSFGITLFAVIIIRTVYRFKKGFLKEIGSKQKPIEIKIKKINQFLLIACSLLMPTSGVLMSVFSGRALNFFNYNLIPKGAYKIELIATNANSLHTITAYTIIGLLILHVAGVIKHKFIYKDKTLERMMGMK